MVNQTLLIVNDDKDQLSLFKDYLGFTNPEYSIRTAQGPIQAAKLASALKPAVALIDRNLREGNGTGLNLAMHLKRMHNTNCILTSSQYLRLDHQKDEDLKLTSAKAAFVTPIKNYDTLVNTIEKLMGESSRRKAQ